MEDLLKVENLRVHFLSAAPDRFAVDDISFSVGRGEILGLVGESGSGKSVTAMSICGLLPWDNVNATGSVTIEGKDLLHSNEKTLLSYLGDELAVVFQSPMSSMNPVMKIGPQVEECLRIHKKNMKKAERKAKAIEALKMVELADPETVYNKYPHQLSGGQLQRVMIAAAIINEPQLLLADEPTTALDVTIQGQILDLLIKLNKEKNISVLFISHNLQVVRKLCSRVIVMKRGKIVEQGNVEDIFHNPQHEYTKELIAAIPDRSHRLVDEVNYGK